MVYKLIGTRKGKKYVSRKSFNTKTGAIKYGYKLTYTKSGNRKKKSQLTSWRVVRRRK